ncbi:MAG TPA: hypothetical protein VGH63_15840, partial [Polyangia bacterium]
MKALACLLFALLAATGFADERRSDEQARQAHLRGDANLLAEGVADRFLDVGRGRLEWTTREQLRERFTKVFATTKYWSWETSWRPWCMSGRMERAGGWPCSCGAR